MTHDPREALKPCPFCGGEAERIDIPAVGNDPDLGGDPNAGGSCIQCKRCTASTALHFDRKENLYSSWNDRMAGVAEQSGAGAPETSVRCGAPAALTASPGEQKPVAWIDFADNRNVRLWTSEQRRADAEMALGRKITPVYTSPPPAAGWNEAIEAAKLVVERWSLPTIQTPSMWLIDKAVIVAEIEALRREAPASLGVTCANCKCPLTTSDAPLFCGCCREMGASRPDAWCGVREADYNAAWDAFVEASMSPDALNEIREALSAVGDEAKKSEGGSRKQPFDPADAAGVKSGTVTFDGQTGRPNRDEVGASQTPGSSMSFAADKPIVAEQALRPSDQTADVTVEELAKYIEFRQPYPADAAPSLARALLGAFTVGRR